MNRRPAWVDAPSKTSAEINRRSATATPSPYIGKQFYILFDKIIASKKDSLLAHMKWGYHPEVYVAESGLTSLPKPKKQSPDNYRSPTEKSSAPQPRRHSTSLPKLEKERKITMNEALQPKNLNGNSSMPAEPTIRLSNNRLAPLYSKESSNIQANNDKSSPDDLLFDMKREESSLSMMFKAESPDDVAKREQILSNWSSDDLYLLNTSDRKYSVVEMERILEGQKREVAEYPEQVTPEALATISEMEDEVRNK